MGSGNLQLDIRNEGLALGNLLQGGDFLLLDDRNDSGWKRVCHREDRRGRVT